MYRITVAEHSKPTDGKFVEIIGHYNPIAKDQPLEVKKDRVDYWVSQGVQVSNTVAKLLNKIGYKFEIIEKKRTPKKKIEESKKETPPEINKEESEVKETTTEVDNGESKIEEETSGVVEENGVENVSEEEKVVPTEEPNSGTEPTKVEDKE